MSEPQDLGCLLAYCSHLGRQYSMNLLRQKGYDVTPVQTRTLIYLSDCRETANQRDLERELCLRPSTVNGIVSRLEEKGYVVRQTSPTDGRCRLVRLTASGQEKLAFFRATLEETSRQFVSMLTAEEQTHLEKLLSKIIAYLEIEVNNP